MGHISLLLVKLAFFFLWRREGAAIDELKMMCDDRYRNSSKQEQVAMHTSKPDYTYSMKTAPPLISMHHRLPTTKI